MELDNFRVTIYSLGPEMQVAPVGYCKEQLAQLEVPDLLVDYFDDIAVPSRSFCLVDMTFPVMVYSLELSFFPQRRPELMPFQCSCDQRSSEPRSFFCNLMKYSARLLYMSSFILFHSQLMLIYLSRRLLSLRSMD